MYVIRSKEMAGRVVLFAFLTLIAYTTAEVQNDKTRIKRSPYYCDYPPPPPPSPPPPPPPPLGPPPPPPSPPPPHHPTFFWYHDSPIMPNLPRHGPIQWQAFIQPQQTNENKNRLVQYEAENSQADEGYDQNQFGNNDEPPCEKCGKKNTAISNAQSETGDAVAIAISKGSNQ